MTVSAYFAQCVRGLRETRGWTQADLVRKLAEVGEPLQRSRVSVIEADGRGVTLDQADAFARAFDVPLTAMMPPGSTDDRITTSLAVASVVKAALVELDDFRQRIEQMSPASTR